MGLIKAIALIAIAIALIMGGYSDYKTRKVPNIYPLIILAAGLFIQDSWGLKILGFILPFAIIPLAEKITKTKSGGADIKMYAAIGLSFSLYGLTWIVAGMLPLCIIGSLIKHRSMNEAIPMCTYLAFSGLIYMMIHFVIL